MSRVVERDWKCQSNGNGDGMVGRGCGTDGATSGACRDSKRVGRTLLAGNKTGQREQYGCTMANVPGPSTSLWKRPRRPIDHHVEDENSNQDLEVSARAYGCAESRPY